MIKSIFAQVERLRSAEEGHQGCCAHKSIFAQDKSNMRDKIHPALISSRAYVIFIFALLLFSGSIGLAQNIDYYTVDTEIFSDGKAQVTISVTLDYPNEKEIIIHTFSEGIENVKFQSGFEGFICKTREQTYGSDIVCDISGIKKDSKSFKVTYLTDKYTKRVEKKYLFEQEIQVPFFTRKFLAKVFLPEEMVLPKDEKGYIPENGEMASDGRRIYIYWRKDDMKAEESASIKVTYEKLGFNMPIEIVVLIIVFIIAVTIFYYLKRQKLDMKVVLPVLKADEKKVMEAVLKYGNGAKQRAIAEASGYSKAKVSKVLKNLQERNIIRLERTGRTNRIYLVSDIEEKK